MKKICYLFIFLFAGIVCPAQNLIPNSDFEQHTGCPSNIDDFDSVMYWINPAHSFGSPDYFNQCATAGNVVSVPDNSWGYQPSRSGAGYAGIVLHTENYIWREYIEIELSAPLTAITCYHFEMYVNLGDICENTTSDIAVYFSDTVIAGIQNADPLPFFPQINNTISNIFDTLTWKLVSGDYVATGGEKYIVIGNFKQDGNTQVSLVNPTGIHVLYCLIDDVSLTVCTTGINEQEKNFASAIYPSPFSDKINLSVDDNGLYEIALYNITSTEVLRQKFMGSVSLNTEHLSEGIYLYELRNKDGVIKRGKVVKE